ncbi:HAD-IA family hydrolase [Burkholderia oklahomensis]|uniref:HAD-IA family hydrolase n=1 Tax=Burkholderia oklahomensis TaxID=342113 RepID=UPI00016A7548|nr:HAD-IA family hydrolase [Burkholderia oklahomensis]AJX34565.1 HAD hydrolase, IA, variant 3 family protein [Burkholderia oklahomensis C6786]AOI48727.1 HAD family hydrolase [Burkholderia oklahomensis C6786]KUY58666.1 HAD family hydrolase [Burkholderia oklahomensis C6786]MBI0363086.1 HAD-IA family hydrolase [Burkholderia oklahomensis]SUY27185.1 Phosphatase yihX [Burkholderia oklahomensis]
MTPPIKLVLFDMEGVLSVYDRAARTARLADLTGRPPDAVRHAIWGSGLEARADAGLIGVDQYLTELGELLGAPVSRDDWLIARKASITPNLDAIALAERVAQRSRIAVLTNNCRLVTDYIDYLNPPVARVFGADVYPSATFGAAKPDARAYLGCVGWLGVTADETLFIDDADANVEGAVNAGLLGCKFVGVDALAEELEKRKLV